MCGPVEVKLASREARWGNCPYLGVYINQPRLTQVSGHFIARIRMGPSSVAVRSSLKRESWVMYHLVARPGQSCL